jgi:undecaprenyl-diphosphatase
MNPLHLILLAIVQGAAELLPVSSSAHVIVAEKLLGLDPTTPAMTLLLVMLHTGTMCAVIVYFWQAWRDTYFSSMRAFRTHSLHLIAATAVTGVVGLALQSLIQHLLVPPGSHFEIESLFGNARLMAAALASAGALILVSSQLRARNGTPRLSSALLVGAVQGLCLPFRGFSRSGATISAGLVLGFSRRKAEEFSFALAVVLTPVVIIRELHRFVKAQAASESLTHESLMHLLSPSLIGMLLSFLTGLVALRWLSRWLEQGRWHLFGGYCLVASLVVLWVG